MSERILLDGRKFTGRECAHRYLKERLSLPGWYGNNLDALYDALTEGTAPVHLLLTYPEAVEDNLGAYGTLLIRVMTDSIAARPGSTFRLRPRVSGLPD